MRGDFQTLWRNFDEKGATSELEEGVTVQVLITPREGGEAKFVVSGPVPGAERPSNLEETAGPLGAE